MNSKEDSIISMVVALVALAMDGDIREDQFETLKALISRDQVARDYYFHLINLEILLQESDELSLAEGESEEMYNWKMWHSLQMHELSAPTIEVPRNSRPAKTEPCDATPKADGKTRKSSLYTVILSSAALFFILILIRIMPEKTSLEAARLTDIIDVKWVNSSLVLKPGDRIFTHERLSLLQGVVGVQTEDDVMILIEGPAEFRFTTVSEIVLDYGRLFSRISKQGAGFTVKTPHAMIVDLGTEFSLNVDNTSETTDVFMHKGSAAIANVKGDSLSEIIKNGQARQIDSHGAMKALNFHDSQIMNRPLTAYEKMLRNLRVSAYGMFDQNSSWVNSYIGGFNLMDAGVLHNPRYLPCNDDVTTPSACSFLYFDTPQNESSYIAFDKMPEFDHDSFTVALWFRLKTQQVPTKQFIVSKFSPNKQIGWRIGLLQGQPFIRLSGHDANGDVFRNWISYTERLEDRWHSVVMVVDRKAGQIVGYVNGLPGGWGISPPEHLADDKEYAGYPVDDSFSADSNITSDNPLCVGVRSGDLSRSFNGWVYDLAIWDTALSADTIRQLYSVFPLNERQ